MTVRGRVTGGLLLALLAVTACTADTERPQGSSSSAATPSPTATTPAETSSAPTPEEEAAGTATMVVNELLRVTDAAKQDPAASDWEPEIRQYAGDPAAFLAVTAVRDYAALGLRQEGNTAVVLEVTGVDLAGSEGPTVKIAGCYDSRSTRVIDVESGDVIPPGTLPRYVWDITVTRYDSVPGSPWLVNVLEPLTDRPC